MLPRLHHLRQPLRVPVLLLDPDVRMPHLPDRPQVRLQPTQGELKVLVHPSRASCPWTSRFSISSRSASRRSKGISGIRSLE